MVPSKNFQSGLTDNSQIEEEMQEKEQTDETDLFLIVTYFYPFFFSRFCLYTVRSFYLDRVSETLCETYIYAHQRINPWDTMSGQGILIVQKCN